MGNKIKDADSRKDITGLLHPKIEFDIDQAYDLVINRLISQIK